MSLATRLRTAVSVIDRAPTGTDAYNNPIQVDQAPRNYLGFFDQSSSVEIVIGRDTVTTDGVLILPADAIVYATSAIDIAGVRYEVVGEPVHAERPGHGVHHLEVHLRRIIG